jgi:hypothetical protein
VANTTIVERRYSREVAALTLLLAFRATVAVRSAV